MTCRLVRLSLMNFLSFDNLVFDLRKKNGESQNCALIYGENGSGKTNLIQAMSFLAESTRTLADSKKERGRDVQAIKDEIVQMLSNYNYETKRTPLDIEELASEYRMIGSKDVMAVRYEFLLNGESVEYTLVFTPDGKLKEEKLDSVINIRRGNIFEISTVDTKMRPGLFSKTYSREIQALIGKYWGRHTLLSIMNHEFKEKSEDYVRDNIFGKFRDILDAIQSMEIVRSNGVTRIADMYLSFPRGVIESKYADRLKVAEEVLSRFFTRLYSRVRDVYIRTEEIGEGRIAYELFFKKEISGTIRDIPGSKESAGTKNLMILLPYFLHCADGGMLFVDDLDVCIHDILVKSLLEDSLPEIPGQLVATTHDTLLMDETRADSVFIIRIDMEGYKEIRSVASIEKPHKGTNVQRRYAAGCYRGIPFTGDLGLDGILRCQKGMVQHD